MTHTLTRLGYPQLFLAICLWLPATLFAQSNPEPANGSAATKSDPLVARYEQIRTQQQKLAALKVRPDDALLDDALVSAYISQQQVKLMAAQMGYIDACLKQAQPTHECRQHSAEWLTSYPARFAQAYRDARQLSLPAEDAPAAEQALADARLFDQLNEMNRRDDLFIQSLNAARELNVLDPAFEQQVKYTLTRRAAVTAVFLDRTLKANSALKEASSLLPADETLKARLDTTTGRVRELGASLETLVGLLKELEIDTKDYGELIIAATGQLSAESLSRDLVSELVSGWTAQASEWMVEEAPGLAINLIAVLIILLVAWRVAKLMQKIVSKALNRSRKPVSQLLHRMVVNTVGNLIVAVGALIALSQLGISLGPLLAGVGVIGFVIGFALQDTLSNFASGVMILMYSPFDVGDVIETSGAFGKVSHMSLVNTTILTLDNQTIVVPNNKIWGEVIKNLTHQNERRVDMLFGIAYSSDYEQAEQILRDIVEDNTLILDEPAPIIRMHELADSSVNFVVRPWVKTENYWEVWWSTTKEVKKRFDAAGIEIPFPQRDMHLGTSEPLTIRLQSDS